jgi:lipopolysaccharide export system protein LptA
MAAALLAFAAPAHAQFAPDSDAPVRGSADTAEYKPGLTILRGQVDVRQADTRILADVMNIYSATERAPGSDGAGAFEDVSKIEAIGNFYYITPEQEVRGEQGVYLAVSETFTVTGDVILLQGEDNVVTGDTLVYDLTSNQARVVGTCEGRKCGSEGRVNILIKQNSDSPS